MTLIPNVTVELYGEGKTDIGKAEGVAARPTFGVLPRLLDALCGKPANMLVKRYPTPFLLGKGWAQKIYFAKRNAHINQSDAVVFVMDTEGKQKERMKELTEGRDRGLAAFPMAIGAPHPCIEVWLLADPAAIKKGMRLKQSPQIPKDLESLPAPCEDRKRNPKTVLAQCCGKAQSDLSAAEKDRIAAEVRVLQRLRDGCPSSFAPFANEIEQRIRPLFSPPAITATGAPAPDSGKTS